MAAVAQAGATNLDEAASVFSMAPSGVSETPSMTPSLVPSMTPSITPSFGTSVTGWDESASQAAYNPPSVFQDDGAPRGGEESVSFG